MYTLIYNRLAYSGDLGSTDAEMSLHRLENAYDVEQTIRDIATHQICLQLLHVQQYKLNHTWQHPYGDWGFLVLYKGYKYYEGNYFMEDAIIDYTYYLDEADSVLSEVPSTLDIDAIIKSVREGRERIAEITSRFYKDEAVVVKHFSPARIKYQTEIKERKQLEELLEKYPDMKGTV